MSRRGIVTRLAAAGLAAGAPTALAQTDQTTATIVGFVSDASTQQQVEGALVVATSPNLQGEQTTATDADGEYRFTNLPPGLYKIHVESANYQPFDQPEVALRVLSRIRVNVPLTPEQVALPEAVVVTKAPVIDVGRATLGTTLTAETLKATPTGFGSPTGANSMETAALIAPSATPDRFGISFAGASSPENNVIIDGIPVNDPAFGTLALDLPLEVIQEEQVQTAGFMPEFGRAQGGILNVITKSGGNEFKGSVFLSYHPTPPNQPKIARQAEAIGTERQGGHAFLGGDWFLGFEVGGPVLKDKLWFYAAFLPRFSATRIQRFLQVRVDDDGNGQADVDPDTGFTIARECRPDDKGAIPAACNSTDTRRNFFAAGRSYQMLGKLSYAISPDHSVSAELIAAPGNASRPFPLTDERLNNNTLNSWEHRVAVAGKFNSKFLDRHLVVDGTLATFGGAAGLKANDVTVVDYNADGTEKLRRKYNPTEVSAVQWDLEHPLTDFENDPKTLAVCTDPAGSTFRRCPVRQYHTGGLGLVEDSRLSRIYAGLGVTALFKVAGIHNTAKFGGDIEQIGFYHDKYYPGGAFVRERSNRTFGLVYQDFRQFGEQGDPHDTSVATIFPRLVADTKSASTALFVQDSIDIAKLVTLNAGVRWEVQNLYGDKSAKPDISIGDAIAPRVQAIVDPTQSGRSKIYAHWGRYYESIPLDITDRLFPSEKQVTDNRTVCVGASPTVAGDPGDCPVIPGSFSYVGAGRTPVAKRLQGQFSDVWGVGASYEILPDMSFDLSFTDSSVGRVIEDMSVDDGTTYFIANPGESGAEKVTTVDSTGHVIVTTVDGQEGTTVKSTTGGPVPETIRWPKPERRYQAVTLEVKKNLSHNWLLQASYTFSRSWGNYVGLFKADTAQLDPNNTSEYDLVSLTDNRSGPLPGDRPHVIKFKAAYTYEVDPTLSFTLGGQYLWLSGPRVNALGAHELYGPGEVYVLPRGSMGRLPPFWTLDLRVGVDWTFAKPYKLSFSADCYNVLNRQVKTAVDEEYTSDSVAPIRGGTPADLESLKRVDGGEVTPNNNFRNPIAYQSARAFRFKLAVSF